MTEQFDSIDIQVYISSAWVSIWADVCQDPPIRWNRGIMGNNVSDRVGSPGYLSFDLDNSEVNSAGLVGYYSPNHANRKVGWFVGIPIRLLITFEGQTFYKFYGSILSDGIQADPGSKGNRRVHVRAGDFMAIAARHEIKGLQILSNKTIVQGVGTVVANMTTAPLRTAYTSNAVYTFPTIFDNVSTGVTTASSEFQKLAESEMSNIYIVGDCWGGEALVAEGRNDRTGLSPSYTSNTNAESDKLLMETNDFLLLETGDKILINSVRVSVTLTEGYLSPESDIGWGKNIINRVNTTVYPRKVDASATTTLWTLQQEFWMATGTMTGVTGRYRDPLGIYTKVNGSDMVTPVAGTHYTAGTSSGGTSATGSLTVTPAYGSDSVEYTLINAAAGSICVTMLKAVGKGVYLDDEVTNVYNGTVSQGAYGICTADVDMKYQNDPSAGNYISQQISSSYGIPSASLDRGVVLANRDGLSMYSFLQIEPGKELYFSESVVSYVGNDSVLNGYEAEIVGGKIVWWYPVVKRIENFI